MSEYRVPSMREVEAIPHNGFNVVSTFSGCGGSCLGYRMAGFNVLWANEFISAAVETYKANHPKSILDTRDIRTIQPEDILEAIGLQRGEIDLFDGSPPCASFSTAGKREAGWGKVKQYSDTKQRVDDLFYEYVRLLEGLQPKTFVAENVSGLIKGTAKGYFIDILTRMKAAGYNVKAKVLDAKFLGVPQSRERLIFIGVRNDLGREPIHPKPRSSTYSVRDVIPEAVAFEAMGPGHTPIWKKANLPSDTISQLGNFSKKWSAFTMVKTEKEQRPFTIQELKGICAFPSDFIFTGSFAQQWERMGRAVPPLMMKAIADTVRDDILCRL